MLYIVRHGRTDFNVKGYLAGKRGLAVLIPESIRQIKDFAIIAKLQGVNIDRILVSPTLRTRQTAEIYRSLWGLKSECLVYDERIAELDFGNFTGRLRSEVRTQEKLFFKERSNNKYNFRYPNGESYADVEKRMFKFVKEYCNINSFNRGSDLIVTHSMACRPLLYLLLQSQGVTRKNVLNFEFGFEQLLCLDLENLNSFGFYDLTSGKFSSLNLCDY